MARLQPVLSAGALMIALSAASLPGTAFAADEPASHTESGKPKTPPAAPKPAASAPTAKPLTAAQKAAQKKKALAEAKRKRLEAAKKKAAAEAQRKKEAAAKAARAAAAKAEAAKKARLAQSPTVPAAEVQLAETKQQLRQAWRLLDLARAREQHPDAPSVPPAADLPTDGSDVEKLAAIIDPADPTAALRETPLERFGNNPVAAAYSGQSEYIDASAEEIQARVDKIKVERDRLQGLIDSIADQGDLAGPGEEELSRRCARAGIVLEVCKPAPWDESKLRFDTSVIMRYTHQRWPQIKVIGGWRPYDPYPDHPSGRAVDIMMPNGTAASDVPTGDAIAKYYQEHAAEFGIKYMLWRQRSWSIGAKVGQWKAMTDRGNPTANHMDHVHITVVDGNEGRAYFDLLAGAKGERDSGLD